MAMIKQRQKLADGCGKAASRFGVSAVAVEAAVATGGLAAPYVIAASAAAGEAVGGTTGAASTAAVQAIDKGKVDDHGAVIGNGLFGGALGGISEGIAAKSAAKAKTRANNPSRPRANSQSVSSEAEFFPQHPAKTEGRDSFSFEGGKAQRNSQYKVVWGPKRPGNKLDTKGAAEAAQRDIQERLQTCSIKTRPSKTCVLQDEKGNAFGTSSVRGSKRTELKDTIGGKQTKALKSIPEDARGVGHGNCAEQVAVNNSRYLRQKPIMGCSRKVVKLAHRHLGKLRVQKEYTVFPLTLVVLADQFLTRLAFYMVPSKKYPLVVIIWHK